MNVNTTISRRFPRQAFSLAELMIAVALLSVVILALYSVFDQTQKAFKSNLAQVDVNESARAAMDLIVRDLERATPVKFQVSNPRDEDLAEVDYLGHLRLTNSNFAIRYRSVDKAKDVSFPEVDSYNDASVPPNLRTPFCEVFYFSRRQVRQFQGEGLYLGGLDRPEGPPDGPVGTLYRYNAELVFTNRVAEQGHDIARQFFEPGAEFKDRPLRAARAARIIDGVVLFRVTPSDASGKPMVPDPFDGWYFTRTNIDNHPAGLKFDNRSPETGFGYLSFEGLSFPSHLDVVLGVLEPATFERYKTMRDNPSIAADFLRRNTGRIQIFRQRIPLRTAAREQ